MSPGRRARLVLPLLMAVATGAAACGDDAASSDAPVATSGASSANAPLEGSITVSAASSLSRAFDELGDVFEAEHPDVDVTFTYASSSALVTQIRSGAPADVFASAAAANMDTLVSAGLVEGTPRVVARNRLVIVTKPGNPAGISSVADLASAGVVSLCAIEAPCGTYAQQVLDAAGVAVRESSVTRGQNAGATVTAVSEGDAVAGIVYATDARGAGDSVATVDLPATQNVVASYPIAVLRSSGAPDVAAAFVDLVVGDEGRRILEEQGFLPPA